MDLHRVERIVREILAEYAFPFELVGVHDHEGIWHVTLRHHTRRMVDFDALSAALQPICGGDRRAFGTRVLSALTLIAYRCMSWPAVHRQGVLRNLLRLR